jgi:hypothetical protein
MPDLSKLGVSISVGLSRPYPTELNAPVMHRYQIDPDTHEVWAVVRVDLGGGYLTELEVKRYLPASTGELEARCSLRENGIQELRLVDADGVLHGLTVAAPHLRPEDGEQAAAIEPEEWDDWTEETDRG